MALLFASLSVHRQHCPPTCYRAGPSRRGWLKNALDSLLGGFLLHLLPHPLFAGEERVLALTVLLILVKTAQDAEA